MNVVIPITAPSAFRLAVNASIDPPAWRARRRSISAAMASGRGTEVYQRFHSSPSRAAATSPSWCSGVSGSRVDDVAGQGDGLRKGRPDVMPGTISGRRASTKSVSFAAHRPSHRARADVRRTERRGNRRVTTATARHRKIYLEPGTLAGGGVGGARSLSGEGPPDATATLGLPTLSHCPYCSLQCGITMTPAVAGRPQLTLQPQQDFPTNRGGLCAKGWTAASLLDHPDRLLTPLVRTVPGDRRSRCAPASWDEALDLVAAGITAAQQKYGRDGVGCLRRRRPDQREGLPARQVRPGGAAHSAIDYNGRFCMSSAATAGNRAFGVDRGLPFPLADIAEAAAVLLVGGNPADTMPPAMQYFDAGRANGAVHIVVDPRRPRPRPARAVAPAAAARHRPGPGQRPAAHRDPRGPDRRGVHRRPHHGFRRGPRRGRRRTGRTGWSGSPVCRVGATATRSSGRWPPPNRR